MSHLPDNEDRSWTGWYISVAAVLLLLIFLFHFITQLFA